MHKACNSVKADMAPDEFIIATTLRTHGYIRSIQRVEMREGLHFPPGTLLNCYPTMVIFPAESSPHPVCWTDPDEAVKCQVGDVTFWGLGVYVFHETSPWMGNMCAACSRIEGLLSQAGAVGCSDMFRSACRSSLATCSTSLRHLVSAWDTFGM